MKTSTYLCPKCQEPTVILYQLGEGGITKIQTHQARCISCHREFSELEIVNHICEKDEELNENC